MLFTIPERWTSFAIGGAVTGNDPRADVSCRSAPRGRHAADIFKAEPIGSADTDDTFRAPSVQINFQEAPTI